MRNSLAGDGSVEAFVPNEGKTVFAKSPPAAPAVTADRNARRSCTLDFIATLQKDADLWIDLYCFACNLTASGAICKDLPNVFDIA
jgi:hypothetical protein